jgi:hypothetical protein
VLDTNLRSDGVKEKIIFLDTWLSCLTRVVRMSYKCRRSVGHHDRVFVLHRGIQKRQNIEYAIEQYYKYATTKKEEI